jgi:hypothetical protein
MNLTSELPGGGKISIQNKDGQTRIALDSSGGNSSQSQANSFSTGEWKGQPTLFKTSDGAIVQIEADGGKHFFEVKGTSIHSLDSEPSLGDAEKLPLHEAPDEEGSSMEPMKPMEPMKGMEPMKPMS